MVGKLAAYLAHKYHKYHGNAFELKVSLLDIYLALKSKSATANMASFEPKTYIPLRRKTTGVGDLRWVIPPTQRFCVTYTNMLVSKKAKICVTPNANPQCESVEYRLRWVPNAKFLH